jgi:hypothetical protein
MTKYINPNKFNFAYKKYLFWRKLTKWAIWASEFCYQKQRVYLGGGM